MQHDRGVLAREILRDYMLGKITDIDRRADIEGSLFRMLEYPDITTQTIRDCTLWACGYTISADETTMQRVWIIFAECLGISDSAFIQKRAKSTTKELLAYARLLGIGAKQKLL